MAALATSATLGHLVMTSQYETDVTRVLIMTSYNLSSFTCRFSTWNSLILVLVRTVNIVRPHYQVQKKPVLAAILLFLLLTVLLFLLEDLAEKDVAPDIWHRVRFNLVFAMTARRVLMWLARHMCDVISVATIWTVCVIIPFVVPAAVAVAAVGVQIYHMAFKPGVARKSKTNRRITMTILYLTGLYVLVNTLYFAATLLYLYVVKDMNPAMCFVLFTTSTLLPFISSLANPIIIAVRGRKIREHVLSCLMRHTRRVSGVSLELNMPQGVTLSRPQSAISASYN